MRGPGELTKLRYGGLLAAGVLAAGAFPAGALPRDDPGFGFGVVVCLIGLAGLAAVWWRTGIVVRAGSARMRWLIVTGSLWALPLLVAPPLASRDVYAYACQGSLYADGVDPYSMGVAEGGCPWVESVSKVWRHTPTPYGPLAVAVSGVAVRLARAAFHDEYARLVLTVGLLRAVAVLGAVLMAWSAVRLARACGVDPLVATWLGVLSPIVSLHLLSAAHHDGLLAGLVLAGLAFAADPRTRWMPVAAAGVALGLAAAVKVTAVVALPFAVLLVARHDRPVRAVAGLVAAAGGVFAAVSAVTGLWLGWVHALPSSGRVVQWTSVPSGVGVTAGYLVTGIGWGAKSGGGATATGSAVAAARLAGLAVLAVVLAALWVRAARLAGLKVRAARTGGGGFWSARTEGETRAVVLHCGAAFGACVLLAPVFFPWYAAAPLAVLAASVAGQRVRWRLAAGVVVLGFLVLPNGHGLASMTKLPGALADTVLVAALVWRYRRTVRSWLVAGGRAPDRDRSRARRVVDATR